MPDSAVKASEFTIQIEQLHDFEFKVRFDKEHYAELRMDEPAPLGQDAAPSPARVLAAAIGNCLSASLLFCARKSRVTIGPIQTKVRTEIVRNDRGRLRGSRVEVEIDPHLPESEKAKAARCLDLFEDFCVVTQSVRDGIAVDVKVRGFEPAA
jgi:organic hydroperoxide reductase OsmC/OhrA